MLENQIQLTPEDAELVETFAPINPGEVYSSHTIVLEEKDFNSLSAPTIVTREGSSVGKTEEYHRSEHNDFATSKELKDRKFSGIRNNSISNCREIWVDGILSASMNEEIIRLRPHQWDRLYSEVFGLMEVITEGRE